MLDEDHLPSSSPAAKERAMASWASDVSGGNNETVARHRKKDGGGPLTPVEFSSSFSPSSSAAVDIRERMMGDRGRASSRLDEDAAAADDGQEERRRHPPAVAARRWRQEVVMRGGGAQWISLALASGACAAFNGVFAKLYVCRVAVVGMDFQVMVQTGRPADRLRWTMM